MGTSPWAPLAFPPLIPTSQGLALTLFPSSLGQAAPALLSPPALLRPCRAGFRPKPFLTETLPSACPPRGFSLDPGGGTRRGGSVTPPSCCPAALCILACPSLSPCALADCPQIQCVHPYVAQQPDELSLELADVLNILDKTDDGREGTGKGGGAAKVWALPSAERTGQGTWVGRGSASLAAKGARSRTRALPLPPNAQQTSAALGRGRAGTTT